MKKLLQIITLCCLVAPALAQVPQSNLTIGPKTNTDKSLSFNRNAANKPRIMWDETAGALKFSNDGVTFFSIPAGTVNSVVQIETSNYTIQTTDDVILASASSGSNTMTLPTAVGNSGKNLYIMKTDSTTNTVTVGGTVDGVSGPILYSQLQSVHLVSDGTGWNTLSSTFPKFAATTSVASASGTGTNGFATTSAQFGWLFTISTSSTVAVGDIYQNNSNNFTVRGALTTQSGQVLFVSGTGATSGSTLTRISGAGTSSITFTSKIATYTYTTPVTPRPPKEIEVMMVGGGSGGGGQGGTPTSSSAGTSTVFGTLLFNANGGAATSSFSSCSSQASLLDTTPWLGSSTTSLLQTFVGAIGQGGSNNGAATFAFGGMGAASPLGGAGNGAATGPASGGAAVANSGSGGGGATNGSTNSSPGGCSGAYAKFIIGTPATTYQYAVGTGGAGGSSGGGAGASGGIYITERY